MVICLFSTIGSRCLGQPGGHRLVLDFLLALFRIAWWPFACPRLFARFVKDSLVAICLSSTICLLCLGHPGGQLLVLDPLLALFRTAWWPSACPRLFARFVWDNLVAICLSSTIGSLCFEQPFGHCLSSTICPLCLGQPCGHLLVLDYWLSLFGTAW